MRFNKLIGGIEYPKISDANYLFLFLSLSEKLKIISILLRFYQKQFLIMKVTYLFLLSLFLITASGCIGSGSCEQFNIDSFEITSGMNIPKVTSVDCFANDSLRISLFYLDLSNSTFQERYGTMGGYADNYKMEPIKGDLYSSIKGELLLPKGIDLACETYHEVSGTTKKGRYWKYLVCKEKNLLICEMNTK